MTLSNNELAAMGVGFSSGAGAGVVDPAAGLGIGAFGIGMILIAIKRQREQRQEEERYEPELETDGGAIPDETPQEAAPEQPTVLNVEISGDRMLASAERGDISLVVEAPAGTSEDELAEALEDVPGKIERTADLFTGGDR